MIPRMLWALAALSLSTPVAQAAKWNATDFASDAIANVAERRVRAVVNISTTKAISARPGGHPLLNDPFFKRFFGPGAPQQRRSMPERENSLGSGVIVRKSGVILTNNHVIEGATKIRVTLSDGRDFDAEVVGADPKSDIAVIKMLKPPKDLAPIALGDSDRLRLGEMVVAIGNPFGLGHTVTMGIVSAKGRANVGIVDYEDFIQTDAAINPGNSGGALIDLQGRLIGINTAIASRSGGYQGIGFAVPSNMARAVMNSLLKHGRVVRGWLGVAIQPVTKDLQRAMGLKTTKGVLISDVMQDSPAARSGIKRGDVIVELAGETLKDPAHLRNRVAAAGSGSRVKLKLLRKGRARTMSVKLGELEGDGGRAQKEPPAEAKSGHLAGLVLENIDGRLREQYAIPQRIKAGVVVTAVEPGSPADRAGVQAGDVLVEVNQKSVRSLAAFKQRYKRSGKRTLLLIQRRQRTLYIVLNK